MTAAEIAAIEAEIVEINIALSHIRKGGQSYTITSASGAGTSRMVTMADYNTLIKQRNDLQRQLDGANGKRGFRAGCAW
jgi:hypothetical protein